MVEYDPFTNEEIVAPEDINVQPAEIAEDEDQDHWFFKYFQYGPINWWI